MMTTCPKCKRFIYKRDDGTEMVRINGIYDGEWDWRDVPHKCKLPKRARIQVPSTPTSREG